MSFHSLLECFLWEVSYYSYHLSPICCLFRLIWIPLRYFLSIAFIIVIIYDFLCIYLPWDLLSFFFYKLPIFDQLRNFYFSCSMFLFLFYFPRIPNTCNLNSLIFLSKVIETLFFYFYSFSLCVYLQIISTDLSWNSLTLFSILSNLH